MKKSRLGKLEINQNALERGYRMLIQTVEGRDKGKTNLARQKKKVCVRPRPIPPLPPPSLDIAAYIPNNNARTAYSAFAVSASRTRQNDSLSVTSAIRIVCSL